MVILRFMSNKIIKAFVYTKKCDHKVEKFNDWIFLFFLGSLCSRISVHES